MAEQRCYLLWRRGELVVATVCRLPYGQPENIWFQGEQCTRISIMPFFDHLVTPDKKIVGFELFTFPDDDVSRKALQDLLEGRNTTGNDDVMEVVLAQNRAYQNDAAQAFAMQGYVTTSGRTVIALPEYDEGLQEGFESVMEDAPSPWPSKG